MAINHANSLKQQQSQVQKLALTQDMQQTLQILNNSTSELIDFLRDQTLENPLISVTISSTTEHDSQTNWQNQADGKDSHQAFLEQLPAEKTSLFDHLLAQVHLNYRDTFLRTLLIFLVDHIDANGYLTLDLVEACAQTDASQIDMLDALTLLQQLEPAGVGARNLQECLMLQTERDNQAPDIAYLLLEDSFEPLVERKWETIRQKYDVSLQEIQIVFDYIQTLTPRPGAVDTEPLAQFILPDLIVTQSDQSLEIQTTKARQPQLTFKQKNYTQYQTLADPELNKYLTQCRTNYDWLKQAIEKREATILRVGKAILQEQTDFFLKEDHPLNPLTLKKVAKTLNLHESTVSRAVHQKYMLTPFGIFELKSFFTQGVLQHKNGKQTEALTNSVVKLKIQDIIANENPKQPFSDQKITDLLHVSGIDISRRTVVKYRDALGIPTSRIRKRY